MNREELPRIRLKVATNAGINILCTAVRTWRVVQWLPHIEEAYREVKEEQEGDEDSKKRFIKAIRIKKGSFYIANSELIGDIFEDNDEVQCEIAFPQNSNKPKSKKEKKVDKKTRKQGVDEEEEGEEVLLDKDKEDVVDEKQIDVKIAKNGRKRTKKESEDATVQKQQSKKTEKHKKEAKQTVKPLKMDTKQQQKIEKKSESLKQTLMKSIDFSKLKSILNGNPSKRTPQKYSQEVKQQQSSPSQRSDT